MKYFLLLNSLFFFFKPCPSHTQELTQGMNLWQAIIWSLPNEIGGQRERLGRELSRLKQKNVKLVRILASVQGSENAEFAFARMLPSCERKPIEWRVECQEALKYLLDQLKLHEMKAIVVISNFWHWSGGFAQYQAWAKGTDQIPYAFGAHSSYWEMKNFFESAADFYSDNIAQSFYFQFLQKVVSQFKGHEAIDSWQLANEPTPKNQENFEFLLEWAKESVKRIRMIDPQAHISLGGVGEGPLPFWTFTDMKRLHQEIKFNYMTIHLWPQNWSWYFPRPEWLAKLSTPIMNWLSERYLRHHAKMARELNIPLILEEVGLARDGESLDPTSSTKKRESFFELIKSVLISEIKQGTKIKGILYWAWAGEARPAKGLNQWMRGQAFVGDPPQEPQGWYSIYDSDHW